MTIPIAVAVLEELKKKSTNNQGRLISIMRHQYD